MKMQVTTAPSVIPAFEELLAKMEPHFKFFAKRVLRLRGDDLDDVIQELSTIAYELYLSLVHRGKAVFYSPLARYATQRYQEGRRFIGYNSTDALSEGTRQAGRSEVAMFSQFDMTDGSLDFLIGEQSDVSEGVSFRIDFFDGWLQEQTHRDKKIIRLLAMGEQPTTVAKRVGVTPATITYSRRRYAKSWNKYRTDDRDFTGQSA